jgi:two-component system, NarL family, response regulator DegU
MRESNQRIRVMIVDDHPLFRTGLQRVIEFNPDLEFVGSSDDGEKALADSQRLKPDVMLLDINLPSLNGILVAKQLFTHPHPPRIVILTAHHDDEQILHAFGTGATGYCTKDVHADALIQVIRDVYRGYYIANNKRMNRAEFDEWYQQQRDTQKGSFAGDDEDRLSPLSVREMEILSRVTDGLLNKEIAVELGISQQTVKNHITSILKKLNVKDRTQAAVTALKRGWVRLNEKGKQEA